VHPDRPALAFVAANYLLGGDLEAGLELFRECLSAAPDSVDLHRYYQEFWPYAQRAAVIAEYDALLAENPSSAMLQYLAGRLRDDADAALAFYTRAMELEPDFPPSYRAYGYQASIAGDLDTAARMYERYAAFSPQHADECVRERVRVSRWQGRPAREIAALLEETTAGEYETEAAVLRRHLAVAASPARLEEEMKALAEGPSEGAALLEAQAALAVTAGRLELARERLGALGDLGGGSQPALGSLLRLALSDGSAADDRTRLRERLASDGAGALSGGEVLLALALAKGQAWPQQGEISERLEGTELAAAAALVREPSAISSSRLAEALVPLAPSERAVVHLALALRASGAQRGRLRRQARNLALPDELPWLR
jgi:tetratricopeptide (TPR) repeat protein